MLRTRRPLLALVALAVLLAGGYLLSALRSDPGADTGSRATTATVRTGTPGAPAPADPGSGTAGSPGSSGTGGPGGQPGSGPPGSPGSGGPGAAPGADGLRVVAASALPVEARRTLTLIARGGPYPYPRDGIVFGNVERLLPQHPRGWYHEFTVPTPGESDRGTRRIIAGRDGARYYTADHYESFVHVDTAR